MSEKLNANMDSNEAARANGELDDAALEQVNGGIIAILIELKSDTTATSSGNSIPTESLSLNFDKVVWR